MDNFNKRQFYSEDDWQSLSTPIVKKEETVVQDDDESEFPEHVVTKNRNKHPVLTFQLTLAICVLLFLFVLKFLGTPAFGAVMTWYDSKLSESVIYNGDFESFDFSSLFATADEV